MFGDKEEIEIKDDDIEDDVDDDIEDDIEDKEDDDKKIVLDKDSKDEEGDEEDIDDKDVAKDKITLMMSKKKSKKKMTKEQSDWYNSVIGQLNSDPNQKSWDGFSTLEEDALLPPQDQNAGLSEPGPGEVGFAPSQRVGTWFGG